MLTVGSKWNYKKNPASWLEILSVHEAGGDEWVVFKWHSGDPSDMRISARRAAGFIETYDPEPDFFEVGKLYKDGTVKNGDLKYEVLAVTTIETGKCAFAVARASFKTERATILREYDFRNMRRA